MRSAVGGSKGCCLRLCVADSFEPRRFQLNRQTRAYREDSYADTHYESEQELMYILRSVEATRVEDELSLSWRNVELLSRLWEEKEFVNPLFEIVERVLRRYRTSGRLLGNHIYGEVSIYSVLTAPSRVVTGHFSNALLLLAVSSVSLELSRSPRRLRGLRLSAHLLWAMAVADPIGLRTVWKLREPLGGNPYLAYGWVAVLQTVFRSQLFELREDESQYWLETLVQLISRLSTQAARKIAENINQILGEESGLTGSDRAFLKAAIWLIDLRIVYSSFE